MFTLGIPKRYYRRATQVLGPESPEPINYNAHKQDDGFYHFEFSEVDEYDFSNITKLLKKNGVLTIGADEQLTEKNIMKLTDLITEIPSPDENNLIDDLKKILQVWERKQYNSDQERWQEYFLDIEELVEDYEEEEVMNRPDLTGMMDEGSCGYTDKVGGEKLNTPGGTKGIPSDKRTSALLKLIRKEIKNIMQ